MEEKATPPQPAETVELVDPELLVELEAFDRRLDLVEQLLRYAEAVAYGRRQSGLLAYQVPAFSDAVAFFAKHAKEIHSLEDLTLSGYLDLPTSFGKTVMMAKLAEAFGIGGTPEGRVRKRNALVLVPTQEGVEQTIGSDDGGFATHAPGLTTGGYYAHSKTLGADVTVMTYASFHNFLRRIESGEIEDPDFDIVMCDEAHHALGPETSQLIRTYCEGKILLGLTATVEYEEGHTVGQVFSECIHKSELRPLIERGVVNGVQLIGVATQKQITTKGRGEFTERELGPLMFDKDRNEIIVEITKQLVAEGRRGMINALKGQKATHAKLLAQLLDGEEIIGVDGQPIVIRAEAIHSYMSADERRRILREYKEGKIHVLTQVQALNENWDEDEVSFIVNAAPTGSKVVAHQRIGRGMRQFDDWPITVLVELMDDVVGRKRAITAWDVFGEDDYAQDTIITTPERRARIRRERQTPEASEAEPDEPTSEPGPSAWQPDTTVAVRPRAGREPASQTTSATQRWLTFDLESLSEDLRQRTEDFTLRVARELTIKPQEKIGPPKPGWIMLVSLEPIGRQKGMGIFAMRSAIVNEGKFGCELAETPAGDRYYVEPGAEQFMRDYDMLEFAPKTYMNVSDMEREFGVSRQVLEQLIAELKATPKSQVKGKPMRSPTLRRRFIYYNPAECAIIKARVEEVKAEMPQQDDDVVFLSTIVKETGVVRGPIQFFLTRHHGIIGKERRSPVTTQMGMSYTKQQADIARFHFSHEEMPKGAVTLDRIEQATGLPEATIRQRIEARKLQYLVKPGRFADARGDYHYTLFCMPENLQIVVQGLVGRAAPPNAALTPQAPVHKETDAMLKPSANAISYRDLLRELRCNPAVAGYLLRQLPFSSGVVRRSDNGDPFIESYAAVMLRRRCNEIGAPPQTSRSDLYFAERFNCRVSEVHEVVASVVPQPNLVGLFRTEDRQIITFHYAAKLAQQIEHILRQRYGLPS